MTLNILAVSSEAYPLAKSGGLGDAVSGLAKSVYASGAAVTLMLPAYPSALRMTRNIREVARREGLPGGDVRLLAGECPELGMPVLLVENDALYGRDGLYMACDGTEYSDNAVRFAALAHAAAWVAQGVESVPRPHLVHVHDWHAALAPLLIRQLGVADVKTIITLHNIAFQGVFPMSLAPELGIEEQYRNDDGVEFWGQLSFLKAGIRYADLITTVSHNYAREIMTPEFGCGLDGLLASRSADLVSIPNGIDTSLWNPGDDAFLPGRAFSLERMGNKILCKKQLQRAFGLDPEAGTTVMAMGSRLTTQKMADVAAEAIPLALDAHPDLQVCVIGEGDKALEAALQGAASRYPGRCGVHIGFDESQAHLLHAGADMLLHGSRFEPFGLTPLYSMRYGTIPIGSRVGGMVDTIVDPGLDQPVGAMRAATGILFDGARPCDMALAIGRGLALHAMPEIWRAMQRNGMRADFGWRNIAPAYTRAYRALRPDLVRDEAVEQRAEPYRTRVARPVPPGALAHGRAADPAGADPSRLRRGKKAASMGTLTMGHAVASS